MIETIAIFVGKAAASAVGDAIKNAVLGIEYQDVSIEDWGKTAVLAIFAMQSMRPELSFEKKAGIRMDNLQRQIQHRPLAPLRQGDADALRDRGLRRRADRRDA